MPLLRSCALATLAFTTLALVTASPLAAAVTLASPFSDHAVLQQGLPVPVWGTADAGEKVAVTCAGQTKTATADAQGRWRVKLDPLTVGGSPLEMTIAGSSTIVLKDLLVGEVWVCSGQSNMQMSVKSSNNSDQEIAAATFPLIRLYSVERKTSDQPLETCKGDWKECTPANIPQFSAVAYFFGRHLHQELKVPIGLIHTSWGGTPAEAWTSREALSGNAEMKDVFAAWDKRMADLPKAQAKFEQDNAAWKKAAEEAKAAGKPAPKPPRAPEGQNSPHKPASLRNGMITPLLPYAIKGALWYQGESNSGQPMKYRTLLPLMISDWRQAWGQGDFPFHIVQLANYMKRMPDPTDTNWAALREAQWLTTVRVPKTGLAVTIDIGDGEDIHPKNKQDVGKRLALAALAQDYGKQIEYSGPVFKELKTDGAKAIVSFTHLGGGLVAKGGKLTGFAIAGEDRKFVWADATVDGDTVVLTNAAVAKPVIVRYAWADNPECSLYNKADLPAVPFRSDMPATP